MLGMQVAYKLLTGVLMKVAKHMAVLNVNSSESPLVLFDCTNLSGLRD